MHQLLGYLFACLPGRVYAKFVKKRQGNIIETKLNDTQCGFCRTRSTTEQIFTLQQIIEKSWKPAKDVYTCFVDLGKVYGQVTCEKLWGVLREYGVEGAFCWPPGHCIPARKIVSVSTELNHNRSALVLDSNSGLCCHHSSTQFTSGFS